jgi:hypothetical protein
MVDAPEVAPFFDKPGGGDTLLRLLQDYGPLWQVSLALTCPTYTAAPVMPALHAQW